MQRAERSDEELMAAYVDGDRDAFRLLFERYALPLLRLIRRRVRTDDEANDILQQTFLHMHRARRDFRRDSRLRPWLFTIALNLVREHYRRRQRRPEVLLDVEGYSPSEPVVDPGTLERRQQGDRVRAALATLPESQREVIETVASDMALGSFGSLASASPSQSAKSA
jgi:RNA polymerase sigma-70 factor (ECF subfamily)